MISLGPDDDVIVIDAEATDDPIVTVAIETPFGTVHLMADVAVERRSIVLMDVHVGGDGANSWGPRRLRLLARAVMEKPDVDKIELVGAIRTTGAGPGRRPRPLRFARAASPEGDGEP